MTGLTATAGNQQVALSWTAPSDGGSEITRYEYQQDAGDWTTTGGTGTTFTKTGLTNDTAYSFKVRAVNSVGNGAESASVSATPEGPPTPTPTPVPPTPTPWPLDTITFEVGTNNAGDFGYKAGEYGSLIGGQFPGELFADGQPRNVEAIYETPDGEWVLTFSGGATRRDDTILAGRATGTDLGNILLGLIPLSLGLVASGRIKRLPFRRHKASE